MKTSTTTIIPANIQRYLPACKFNATSYFTPISGRDIDHIVAAIAVGPAGVDELGSVYS
ncbi:hypothetical protein [Hymenobacter sedentarius]|uniref:hypothetical protein n=1 Tax=Hymenobacter sedentarius TaxID=1411621 RepID=UPI000ADF87F5|nr:hypothetical protein [Hymenobacter sedentarius]